MAGAREKEIRINFSGHPNLHIARIDFLVPGAISFAWGELGVRVLGRRSVEATQSGEVELFVPVPVSLFKILEKFNKFEC